MTTLRRSMALLLTGLFALGALAACGDDGGTEVTAGEGNDGTAGRRLVVRMEMRGGFLPPEAAFREVPTVSVYSDGLVITQGAQIEIFPPPALPALVRSQLSDDELEALLDDARQSGVFEVDDFGQPPVADAGATVFILHDDGETKTASVYALGIDEGAGLTPEQQEARRKALALQQRLGELPGREGEEMYEAERVAILVTGEVTPGTPEQPDDGVIREPSGGEVDWPGPALATFGDEDRGWPGRCGVLEGTQAEAVLAAAAQASTQTPWVSGDTMWSVAIRPMLPDEETCHDVAVFADVD